MIFFTVLGFVLGLMLGVLILIYLLMALLGGYHYFRHHYSNSRYWFWVCQEGKKQEKYKI